MSFREKHENKFVMVKIYDHNHSQTHSYLVEVKHEQPSYVTRAEPLERSFKTKEKKGTGK